MKSLKHVPCIALFLLAVSLHAQDLDLLKRYPTTLTDGDTSKVRPWEFESRDIFRLSKFDFSVGKNFHVETGAADLGIGHCSDGAVWAVVVPRGEGTLTSSATDKSEGISHVWLRFHPGELNHLFPPGTVFNDGASNLAPQMQAIANFKIQSSWQGNGNALIPPPKDMTVDMDVKNGPRRFFVVDTAAGTAEYVNGFERQPVKLPPPITPELAASAFDKLWQAFDRDYAMFILRPDVDWQKLREGYRPRALKSASVYEFAATCAEMLKPLRDLHIGLTVAGAEIPVFNRPRSANANPAANESVLGQLNNSGHVQWTVTADKIGYIAIYGWSDSAIPSICGEALEQMRDTRGLILDVRLNGGGSEPLAEQVAGRFIKQPFVYAYSQYRNGPAHTNLTEKFERRVVPRGPWRYDRPVLVLIGQKCMSSNESFVGMMTGDPDAMTMGDHTCGSSGNPKIVKLPLDMTARVPQWIDYQPDGTPLDEHGFRPQIVFTSGPGAFDGERDDLLSAAIVRLRKSPLPDKPITGPIYVKE